MIRRVNIGLLGGGTVGSGFARLLASRHASIADRHALDVRIEKVLVRDPSRRRPGIDSRLVTTRPDEVVENGCDLVVEVMGRCDPTMTLIERVIDLRKNLVTANKALLATRGTEIFERARHRGVRVGFEASVCGGVPVIRAIRSGLAGDRIESIGGVLNGTCNYILTLMDEQDLDFDSALGLAREKGFAEVDPSLDIDGHDASQKLSILSAIAFDQVDETMTRVEGIRGISPREIRAARRKGGVIRHVAKSRVDGGVLVLDVRPEFVEGSHPFASVRNEDNAVLIRSAAAGELFLRGKGAGAMPTASAVLADVIEIAKNE